MEREKTLAKFTELFTTFLSNKKHRIHNNIGGRYLKKNQANIINSDSNNKYINNAFETEFYIGDQKLDLDTLKKLNKCSKNKINLSLVDKTINLSKKTVVLNFGDKPNLVLTEHITPKLAYNIEHKIVWRGIFRRIFFIKLIVKESKYVTNTSRTFKFGSIVINLTEGEFNKLFSIAEEFNKVRPNEIDEAILDIRINEYKES